MRPVVPREKALVYCLLIESSDGLVLVDTGFGTKDYTQPALLMRLFLPALRTPRDLQNTAVRQVKMISSHDAYSFSKHQIAENKG